MTIPRQAMCLVPLMLLTVGIPGVNANGQANEAQLRAVFETQYQEWKMDCQRLQFSSDTAARLDIPSFRSIVTMGPEIIPYVVEKCLQDTNFAWRGWVWISLTKINPDPSANPWAKDSAKTWWEGGRELARERFLSQYREWKKAVEQGRTQEAEKYRKAIRSMGILALGPLMDELDTDDAVISMIADVVEDEIGGKKADKQEIRSWWTTNRQKYELPAAKR